MAALAGLGGAFGQRPRLTLSAAGLLLVLAIALMLGGLGIAVFSTAVLMFFSFRFGSTFAPAVPPEASR